MTSTAALFEAISVVLLKLVYAGMPDSMHSFTLKMKAELSFETPESNRPTKPPHTHTRPKSSQLTASLASQEIPSLLHNPLPTVLFTAHQNLSLTRTTIIQSTLPPPHPISSKSAGVLWWTSPVNRRPTRRPSLQVSTHKKVELFSSTPCILYSPPILPSLFLSPKLYLVSSGRSHSQSLWSFLQTSKIDRK